MDYSMIDIVVKHGIGVFTVVAGTILLFRLIEHGLINVSKANSAFAETVTGLVTRLNEFASHVKREHEGSDKNQQDMQRNQQEMIKQLNEITLTLGRINGYKKGD